jgi:hypothetical protein
VLDVAAAAAVQVLPQAAEAVLEEEALDGPVTLSPQAEATALTASAAEAAQETPAAQADQEELFFAINYHRNF